MFSTDKSLKDSNKMDGFEIILLALFGTAKYDGVNYHMYVSCIKV